MIARNSKRPWGNTGAATKHKEHNLYKEIIPHDDFFVGLKNWSNSVAGIDWSVAIDGAHRL